MRRVVALATLAMLPGLSDAPARADDATLNALLAKIDAVAKEVSAIRGLPLKHPIASDVVDRDELRARVVKQATDPKSQAQLVAEGLALERWGEVPAGTDYPKLIIDLLTEQIAGYYDPETKKLTLTRAAGDDPAWADLVLSHELDHGLQDQSFDLHKLLDLPDDQQDAQLARRALVEGDAVAAMIEVALARRQAKVDWSNPEVATAIEKSLEQGLVACDPKEPSCKPGAFDSAPLAVREQMIFPYRAGFQLVAALRHRQTWAAVDAAFKKPPRSTEQVLHPERYLAGDEPVVVRLEAPPSLTDWTAGVSMVWGELGFDIFLRAHGVDAQMAASAAAGWGGDRMIVLTRPGDASPEHAVAIARFEWDSEADAIEATEATGRALDQMVTGATIEHGQVKTRWVGFDGQVSWVERKGPSMVIVVGAPAALAASIGTEIWVAPAKKKPGKAANK